MIIIPIGIDCEVAEFAIKNGYREYALPFDWAVTYKGVSDIIRNNLENILPKDGEIFNGDFAIKYVHHTFPLDREKLNRRIDRMRKILNSDSSVIFIRKGHLPHHHMEYEPIELKREIEDIEKLADILESKYKKLDYKIILGLGCEKCYSSDFSYIPCNETIKIFNNVGVNDFKNGVKMILN